MTKEELTTRFKDVVSTNTNLDACNSLLTDILSDYTTHETDATTLSTLNTRIADLTDANTKLQQTNYQLFLQGLNTATNVAGANHDNNKSDDPEPAKPSAEELTSAVISHLKGEKNNG